MMPRNSSTPRPRLVYLLNVTHRRVQAFIRRSADGRTAARAGLLMALAPDRGTPMAQLGRALDLAGPAISNLVERASRAGLVKRRPDPDDGRAWFIELTSAGQAARKDAVREARALNDQLCEGFSDEELQVVARWLDAVRAKFSRDHEAAQEET